MSQSQMFALASTLTKIESGLRPKNLVAYLRSLEEEAVSAQGVFEAMCQDRELDPFLVPAVREAVRTARDTFRQLFNEYPSSALPRADRELVGAITSVYRMWNAIQGRNTANIAMYALQSHHRLCDFVAR